MNRKDVRESRKRRYRMTLGFDAESDAWVVRYPELPGCLAHGATPAEALAEGEEGQGTMAGDGNSERFRDSNSPSRNASERKVGAPATENT
jgi:predicted RNase H-like HicB family nuclease